MSTNLRLLAVDHFFQQDLNALAEEPGVAVRALDYTRLRDAAVRIMGTSVTRGLEGFAEELDERRSKRYLSWLVAEFERWLVEWPFDLLLLPSDTFFYVRQLPDVARRYGIPVAVVQKETTISPSTMETHALRVGRYAPFISDLMTVCSERQKEFWVRSGAESDRIVVTGQPRFDIYRHARAGNPHSTQRRVLFLSYELDAYEPGVGRGMGRETWRSLRDETEKALTRHVRSTGDRLVVKHHPQQFIAGELRRWQLLADDGWRDRIVVVDPNSDTRRLILDADVVVGFQTTSLYEAVAAGRPTIYTGWGEPFERSRKALIPFHAASGCVMHASSPMDLEKLLHEPHIPEPKCYQWIENALGPVDGFSARRVVKELRECVAMQEKSDLYHMVLSGRRARSRRNLLVATFSALWYSAARPIACYLGKGRGATQRKDAAVERLRRLIHAARGE